jgi:hypothetical protein
LLASLDRSPRSGVWTSLSVSCASRVACGSWRSSGRAPARSSRRTPHEPARCGPPVHHAHAPLQAEGRRLVPPHSLSRPSGGSCRSQRSRVHPGFGDAPPWPVVTNPFPRPHASDRIPIVGRPAVQFNPFCPAGLLPRSRARSARGPPDKSLLAGCHTLRVTHVPQPQGQACFN